jgi:RNA-directed DNA polymerase
MESITQFITQKLKLKLKVNEAKSAVARPQERKFPGFSFTAGAEVKRVIAPKALDRFKRIREITRRAKGVNMETTMEELAPYLRGWRSYFGFCETPEVLIGFNPLGPVATQGGYVAAVENTAPSPGGTTGTGGARAAGE